ncbi:MAG TPA: glycoside hydrolase family 13 protein [Candidatus Sulfomarinibacteraceae bacterium]|nr:glycoside hydrolase family 13 protein [Candidatus Sulfomarinibacteraceae bacterium]
MTAGSPAWARDAVFYQVFPDRFASSPRVVKPGAMEPWSAPPTLHGYKGGDLLGLAARIDELVDLGITALYLNPIFSAASNHRYNAYDFMTVDPLLGGDGAFRELLDTAHDRGIRIILDGVFNHVGRGFWPFHHIVESGGASPYRDWFYLDDDVLSLRRGVNAHEDHLSPEQGPRGYRSWWDVPSLPKLRIEHPGVREYLMGVAEHWTRFGIDGWRLDVPQDIEDQTFWPEFRRRVRAINPEAYLVGEIWHDAPEWLAGDRFDALMNYPLALAILGFVGGPKIDPAVIRGQSNYRDGLVDLDAATFAQRLVHNLSVNGPEVTAVQFNLIGSHDSPRARSVMGGDPVRLRLAALLQLTLPGTPSIYYGDEIAMSGGPDPDCRGAYPQRLEEVEPAGLVHRAYVRAAIRARRDHVALRRGEVHPLATAGRAILLERTADGRRALVAVNVGDAAVKLAMPDRAPAGLRRLVDLTIGHVAVAIDFGSIELGAHSAAVLIDD